MSSFKCSLKNFFIEISVYKKREYCVLKTFSYSIVFFSKSLLDAEKNNKNKEVESKSGICDCVDSQIEIQKIFQKVFNDKDIKVNKENYLLKSKYVSTNNYIVSFDTPFSLKLEYAEEVNEEQQQEIKNNFVKIANAIIQVIKDFNKYGEDERVVSCVASNFTFIKEKKQKKYNNNLLKIDDKDIEKTDFTLFYKNEEKQQRLTLFIENKNDIEIECKAILYTPIIGANTINKVLFDKSNEDYIKDKIKALKL